MQLTTQQLSHVVDVWPVARLGTVHPSGAPQMVPIVCVVDMGLIYTPIDGKPKRNAVLQRLRNVAQSAAVCVLLDHYDEDWQALWWVRVDGIAELLSNEPAHAGAFARVERLLRAKYPQYSDVQVFPPPPRMLRVTPTRHAAWSAQPMDWLRLTGRAARIA